MSQLKATNYGSSAALGPDALVRTVALPLPVVCTYTEQF